MNDLCQSLKDRCVNVLNLSTKLAYEDNPTRIGWEFHEIETDAVLKQAYPTEYYLCNLYLTDEHKDGLFSLVDFLPGWIDIYLTGRTSIKNMVEVFTPENLEKQLNEAETLLAEIEICRKEFIQN